MKRIFKFFSGKKVICLVAALLVGGAFLGWEVRELVDPTTGRRNVLYSGITFPWQTCVLGGETGPTVNFRVRRWMYYGLFRTEVTGKMTYGTVK